MENYDTTLRANVIERIMARTVSQTHKHTSPTPSHSSLLRNVNICQCAQDSITTLSNNFFAWISPFRFVCCVFSLPYKQTAKTSKQQTVKCCFFFLICLPETSHNKSQQARHSQLTLKLYCYRPTKRLSKNYVLKFNMITKNSSERFCCWCFTLLLPFCPPFCPSFCDIYVESRARWETKSLGYCFELKYQDVMCLLSQHVQKPYACVYSLVAHLLRNHSFSF